MSRSISLAAVSLAGLGGLGRGLAVIDERLHYRHPCRKVLFVVYERTISIRRAKHYFCNQESM